MNRLLVRLLVVLSLALNAAFAIHLLTRRGSAAVPVSRADIAPQARQQMQRLRRELQPQYQLLQRQLAGAQDRLLQALRRDPVDRGQLDACLADIAAAQAGLQKLTVAEILQCKRVMSRRDCRCLLDRMGAVMGVPAGCPAERSCPAATQPK